MSEKLEELISLLYQDKLTQYGKRLLVENIEKLQKENEELRAKWNKDTHILQNELDLTNADKINNYIPVQKVKDKIEEYKDMCISNANGYKNYFKDNYNELVFRRMEQLEKELLEESEENNNEKNL